MLENGIGGITAEMIMEANYYSPHNMEVAEKITQSKTMKSQLKMQTLFDV